MSRSSARRAQAEPTAALVVFLAVCAGVTAYATALDAAVPPVDRDVAAPTLDRVVDALSTGGVADPNRTARALGAAPAGYRLNVTVAAAGRRWRAGPTPPDATTGDHAVRRTSVRLGPGRVRPGRVRVEVWQ
ncbi:MAG: hypothetical protein ABEJ82_08395 [Haloplanus sp.]